MVIRTSAQRLILRRVLCLALMIPFLSVGFLSAEEKYAPYRLTSGKKADARLLGFLRPDQLDKNGKPKVPPSPIIETITDDTLIVLLFLPPDDPKGEPQTTPPIKFSEFSAATQSMIKSRNSSRRAAIARAEKIKDLMNESAFKGVKVLIQSYEQFEQGDDEPKPIKREDFKKTVERSYNQLDAGTKREPLVRYTYALIRAQLEPEREISHRQLETLVRDYPNYWQARRALVSAVTREVNYVRGASELKRFHDALQETLALPGQDDQQVEKHLEEYFWIVDTAAVFEMKPKTKELAEKILNDPDANKIIQVVEARLQVALDKQRERARQKAIEEEKRIQSLIAQATPIFEQAEQQYSNAWNQNLMHYRTSLGNYQQATFSSQSARLDYQRCANNTDQVTNRLTAAQKRRNNLGADAEQELKDFLDDEVNRLLGDQRAARNVEQGARGISAQADFRLAGAFRQYRNAGFQLQQLLMQARGFLFSFAREYFDAINNDPDLAGKYKVLETTVAGMRQQLFALALQKFGKPNPKLLLKQESQQVVSLLQFSPHTALVALKEKINKVGQK